jgi:uncharacterized membrane protein YadS
VTRPSLPAARAIAPGLALAAGLAIVAYGISHVEPRVSALVAALLLGMLVSNVAGGRATLTPGARFAARRVLRVGIALLGTIDGAAGHLVEVPVTCRSLVVDAG